LIGKSKIKNQKSKIRSGRLLLKLAQQVPNRFARRRLSKGANEAVVAEAARDIFQGAQMVPWPILRRDQQNKDMHRFAVQALEAYTRA